MKTKNVLIHASIWLFAVLVIYQAFGQILRAYETPEGLRYELTYDHKILFVILLDIGLKAALFYAIGYYDKSGRIRFQKTTLTSITVSLILVWAVWATFNYFVGFNTREMIFDYMMPYSMALHLVIPFLSFGYHVNRYHRDIERQQFETELRLLRSKINPHFLFNTLNNIYSIAKLSKADAVSDCISKLAGIMRYMTDEASKNQVHLSQEIKYLNDFIELQRIRLANPSNVKVNLDVENDNLMIAPMLFTPFVENAFKYGAVSDLIEIVLTEMNGNVSLSVKNGINNIDPIEKSGFGLSNVRKRLNLLYPNKHKLSTEEHCDLYKINLSLSLNYATK